MTELRMIREIRPDAALPEPGELTAARSRLTAAIAAAHVDGPAPAAGSRRSRRFRHRRVALVAASLTGAAAIGAAVILVATGGTGRVPRPAISPQPGISPLSPRVAAFVISRAERALTVAERRNLIQEVHAVGQASWFGVAGNGGGRAVSAARAVIWTYRGLIVTEGLTATGQRVFDSSFQYSYAPHELTNSTETVNDITKTWWRDSFHIHEPGQPVPIWALQHSCPAALPSPTGSPGSNWPAEIRLALRCGQYHVAGAGWIDGVRAIKIVPKYQRPPRGVHLVSQVLWVSRSTYLPVQVRWSWPRGHGLSGGSLTGDFTWLAPTRANLAALRVTIPPGYRQLPPRFGGAGFQMARTFVNVTWPLN